MKEVWIENEEMRDERGMRTRKEKSDGCDRQVSIARDAWVEVDYSGPCGLQSIRAVGNEKLVYTASLTRRNAGVHSHTFRYNDMPSTACRRTHTHTHTS